MRKVLFSSTTAEWPTPLAFYAKLDREFQFNLDPCPADATKDGLSRLFVPWEGKRVFCNPPYGSRGSVGIPYWLARWREAELAVYLLPARTDTIWFHEIVLPEASEIRFIRGRLKFGDGPGRAPFPSMVVVFQCS